MRFDINPNMCKSFPFLTLETQYNQHDPPAAAQKLLLEILALACLSRY